MFQAVTLLTVTALGACSDDDSSADGGDSSSSGTADSGGDTSPPPNTSTNTSPPADTTMGGDTEAPTTCGNGELDDGEACDDGDPDDGDGCSASCEIEDGWECNEGAPSICMTVCGDGITSGDEVCDDGNRDDSDACTSACVEATCGDGLLWTDMETCDDANTTAGDGCSDTCQVEAGVICEEGVLPSSCEPVAYLADGSIGMPGNLYAVTLDGETMTDLGALDVGLTGLAFHPDGTLYGVTSGTKTTAQLGTLDPTTLTFTPIGALVDAVDGTDHGSMPDITFVGETLVGWSENGDVLVTIDIETGEVTQTPTQQGASGTGLAYDSDEDALLLAPDGPTGSLFMVGFAGQVEAGATLMGERDAIKGMAFRDGMLFGTDSVENAKVGGDFVTYDPMTGDRTVLAALPGGRIDAVAVYDPNNTADRR